MYNRIAETLAKWIVKNSDQEDSNIVAITYGIELFLEFIMKFICLIVVAVIIGITKYVLFAAIAFYVFRSQAGGYHHKTNIGCTLYMFIIIYGAVYLGYYTTLRPLLILGLYLVCIATLLLTAPGFTENNPITDPHIIKSKKIFSLVIATIYFLPSFFIGNPYTSTLVYIALFECITLFPWLGKSLKERRI